MPPPFQLGMGLSIPRLVNQYGGGFDPADPSWGGLLVLDADTEVQSDYRAPALDWNPASRSWESAYGPTPTIARASEGTYLDEDGLLQVAAINEPRITRHVGQGDLIEASATNLVEFTDFSSGWSTAGDIALSDGDGYQGQPSKILTMDNGSARMVTSPFATVDGESYVAGVWVRLISGTAFLKVYHFNSASGTSQSTAISSEWSFVPTVFLGRSGGGLAQPGFGCNAASVLEIAMPQVEVGSVATSFIENTTGAPKTRGATYETIVTTGALIEPEAEQLVKGTEDLTSANWTTTDATVTLSDETFRGRAVYKVTEGVATSEHALRMATLTKSVAASVNVTASFYVKANGRSKVGITYPTVGDAAVAWDLDTVAQLGSGLGSFVSSSIEALEDGWFRVQMVYTRPNVNATSQSIHLLPDSASAVNNRSYEGDGFSSILVTMPQVEVGSVATSFIPNAGTSTVTRNADVVTIEGDDFSDMWNPNEGTIYVEYVPQEVNARYLYIASDGSISDRLQSQVGAGTTQLYIRANFGTQASIGVGTPVAGEVNRHSATWEGDLVTSGPADIRVSLNGGESTDTYASLPNTFKLNIGSYYNGTDQLNGIIARLIYWDKHQDNL